MTHKFLALDGWRGIAALFIVFYHFNAYSHINQLPLFGGAFLFVDFFFVLSGFVMASSYLDRLQQGYPLRDYILLRFGRIYPLHALVLLLFVLFSFVKFYAEGQIPFSKESQSLHALASSFLLIQGLGIYDYDVWNVPAWSISVEFYTYLAFAFLIIASGRHFHTVCVLLVTIITIFLFHVGYEKADLTYAFLRCLTGFFSGVLCFELYRKKLHSIAPSRMLANMAEISIVMLIAALMIFYAKTSLIFLAPVLFSACVLIFSYEGGILSGLLKNRFFQFLGTVSFTIYMIHTFIQSCFYSGMRILEKITGWDLHSPPHRPDYMPRIGDNLWMGDVACILMAACVLITAALVYRYVEKPANDWIRAKVTKPGDGQRGRHSAK